MLVAVRVGNWVPVRVSVIRLYQQSDCPFKPLFRLVRHWRVLVTTANRPACAKKALLGLLLFVRLRKFPFDHFDSAYRAVVRHNNVGKSGVS